MKAPCSIAASDPDVTEPHTSSSSSGLSSDVLGLGQAIVDWSASVPDEVLGRFNVAKGGRRVVTVDERAEVMQTLDEMGAPSQVSP
ncbi:hypothetical protein TSOC_014430 [Tetrabaena socialis]|uniref:Uncharacterized protein n=1 Tax=Tetrabaena socialis TaxID=47790 RepID=A0A2J7ZHN3_9CHLO|nr:hypothetical protein TSOC_014430 [Tetrabaena socialis]|eukprot:PNG99785.1 hypothetical protein TSOC_014430 [Tetrabaena socialis]